jgi:WD40 repeat protein
VSVYEFSSGRETFATGPNRALGNIRQLAFSQQGDNLLLGTSRGKVEVWGTDSEGGFKYGTKAFVGHTNDVLALDISPDGKSALSGCDDNRVRHWNLETCRELLVFHGFRDDILSVRFTPDGKTALAMDGHKLYSLNLTAGESTPLVTLDRANRYGSVAISPSGSFLTQRSNSFSQSVFDVKARKETATLSLGKNVGRFAAFSPDERLLFVVAGSALSVWDINSQHRVGLWESESPIAALAAAPDGRHVAVGTETRGVFIFAIQNQE